VFVSEHWVMLMVQSYHKTIFWVIYQCRYRGMGVGSGGPCPPLDFHTYYKSTV